MSHALDALVATVARLRGPGGCPWDIEQTHRSICDCLIEEVSELLDTIDRDDADHMREELGDLLLHVVMHAQMAAEAGRFTFDDVAREIDTKMIRRHPHVFGDTAVNDTAGVLKQWDDIKAAEKKHGPVTDGPFKTLHPSLSAILVARDVAKTVDKKRLPTGGLVDATHIAGLAEGLDEAKAGRALFDLVAACRRAGIDPESALRRHTLAVKDASSAAGAGK